jgi:hypothetical protein
MGNVRGTFNFICLKGRSALSCFSLTRRREGLFSTGPMRFLGCVSAFMERRDPLSVLMGNASGKS